MCNINIQYSINVWRNGRRTENLSIEQNGVRLGHCCTSNLLESDISLSQFEKLARKMYLNSA